MPMLNADAIGKTENNPGQLISIFPVRFTLVSVLIYMQGQQINTDLRLRLDATLLIKEEKQPTTHPSSTLSRNSWAPKCEIWCWVLDELTNNQTNRDHITFITPGRGRLDASKEITLFRRERVTFTMDVPDWEWNALPRTSSLRWLPRQPSQRCARNDEPLSPWQPTARAHLHL